MATITVEGWQALAAAVVIVLTAIFKFVLDLVKAKRDADASHERLQVLRDIAHSNGQIREGQIAQNGKLTNVVSTNQLHHEELIRAINQTCKARPIFHQVDPKGNQ